MPKTRRHLNPLGLWLNNELGRKGILLIDFAKLVGITPQRLSAIMRSDSLSAETMQSWEQTFRKALLAMDGPVASEP